MTPPKRQELPRILDRISFLYVEKCRLEKDDGAIVIKTVEGETHIPVGQLLVLLLGPGSTVTHRMVQTASEAGMALVWCGEQGVRFYAGGSPLSNNTDLLRRQAAIVSNPRLRLKAAKRMYAIRYPEEDFSCSTTKQLLGQEGRRVTECYRKLSAKYGVPWSGRHYDPNNYQANDPLQNALSCANACLYGICYAVIFALGLSPGLGIIHTGMAKSFVLDIADIYKEGLSFPTAFSEAKQGGQDLERRVRKRMRDKIKEKSLTKLMIKDIGIVLDEVSIWDEGENSLWAGRQNEVSGGKLYGNDHYQP